tara:strand:+ start:748 stop:888 length:141 start_codon:yes stop_codon:yes gene_type:complete
MKKTPAMKEILKIIKKLDELPPDHEPECDDLWEALRSIERIALYSR